MTCDSKEPIVTLNRSPPPIEHHFDKADDPSWPELLTVGGREHIYSTFIVQ